MRYVYELSNKEIVESLTKILSKRKDIIEFNGEAILNDDYRHMTLLCLDLMRQEEISYEYEMHDFIGWSYGYYNICELEDNGMSLERFTVDDYGHNKSICMAIIAKHTKVDEV